MCSAQEAASFPEAMLSLRAMELTREDAAEDHCPVVRATMALKAHPEASHLAPYFIHQNALSKHSARLHLRIGL